MNLEALEYLSVGSQMRRIYEKLQSMADRVYSDINVTFKSSWFPIYYSLIKTNRALTVSELTESISYSRITVKNVVRELEAEGFVEVLPNPIDARSKLIQLTLKGHSMETELTSVWEIFQRTLESIFKTEDDMFLKKLSEINDLLNGNTMAKEILSEHYKYTVRNAKPEEFTAIGELMVDVYSALKGFPKPEEQPQYYDVLRKVGKLTKTDSIELFTAVSNQGDLGGAVVYFNDMKDYGSGGTATLEKNACGFRLLAVNSKTRGLGVGKLLTEFCLKKGKASGCKHMVIHTTGTMKLAWGMYERLGFKRADDLDFMQGDLPVYGFRLKL